MTVKAAPLPVDKRVGCSLRELDTPVLLADLPKLDANIRRIAETCRQHGVLWRPHIKGIKSPAVASRLLAAGAIGVTCAKLGEAEVMADAGIGGLMIANQIVGDVKLRRLSSLLQRASVIVAVDDTGNAAALAGAVPAAGQPLDVVIEVDVGLRRAGVPPGPPTVELARAILGLHGLRFAGLMAWEGHTGAIEPAAMKSRAIAEAVGLLTATARTLISEGIPVGIVSCGGTATYEDAVRMPGVTEVEAGGGIWSDVRYRTQLHVDHPYALTILATVTSRPDPRRIVCDAGRKSMSVDHAIPLPLGLEGVRSVAVSAEHATIELDAPSTRPAVADQLRFVVGYSDTTVHLHDEIVAVEGERVVGIWPVLARGSTR